ncbi:MAG: DUF3592 domain-containing protein [Burkholderiaceae bacterium]|jgi:hypothetical protein
MSKKLLYKILAVVIGLVFIGTGFSESRHISRLKRFGSQAEVIPPESYTDHSHNGSHTFTAEITFKTASGDIVRQKHSMPEAALESMKARQPVTVFYDSKDPSDFVFAQDSTDWWMPLLGGGFIVAAFFI